jgi:hypothetical protein
MIDLRQPNITGNDHEMLLALKSYLFQLREQLQYAFDDLSAHGVGGSESGGTAMNVVQQTVVQNQGGSVTTQSPLELFNSIKSYIITSGEVVDAYYNKIDAMILESKRYVAESDFGTYKQEVQKDIAVVDGKLQLTDTKVEQIEGTFSTGEKYAEVISTQGYARIGFIGDSGTTTDTADDEYGMEIGTIVGEEKKHTGFAKFSTQEIALYDTNVASDAKPIKAMWITRNTSNCNNFDAKLSIKLGQFKDEVDKNGDIVTKIVKEAVWT